MSKDITGCSFENVNFCCVLLLLLSSIKVINQMFGDFEVSLTQNKFWEIVFFVAQTINLLILKKINPPFSLIILKYN